MHAREAGDVLLTVLHIQVHGEHASPPEALWLAWQGPAQPLDVLWHAYQMRWPVEPSIRTRKQQLAWTLPQFCTNEACDRWTMLVSLAQWLLFLARPLIPLSAALATPTGHLDTKTRPAGVGRAFRPDWHPSSAAETARNALRMAQGT